MIAVTLANAARTLKFRGTDYDFDVNDDGDLQVLHKETVIGFFPEGHWKYVLALPEEFSLETEDPHKFEMFIDYKTTE